MDATKIHAFIIRNNNLPNLRMLEMGSTLLDRGRSKSLKYIGFSLSPYEALHVLNSVCIQA